MLFRDISIDPKTEYLLDQPGETVFFMMNRVGDITFHLTAPGAQATILSLFIDTLPGEKQLRVTQNHTARETTSHFYGKALVGGEARFLSEGLVKISGTATLSDASQETRHLLVSEKASALSRPSLEIETNDVRCHHAATTSTLGLEALFFAESRGLEEHAAKKLLARGFALSLLDHLPRTLVEERKAILQMVEDRLEFIFKA